MNKIKLRKLLIALKSKPVDEIPKGWMCRADIQKQFGMAHCTASRYIKYIQDHNPHKIQTKKFRVKNNSGTIIHKPYYLIKE